MFNVRIDFSASGLSRQELQQRIRARKIETGTHYPPIHLFALYRRQGYCDGDFPNAEKIGADTLTLPLFPSMDANAVERVCEALHAALT
jgi:dTDP-4-amino-4,6-dideoxygalactose transaminase